MISWTSGGARGADAFSGDTRVGRLWDALSETDKALLRDGDLCKIQESARRRGCGDGRGCPTPLLGKIGRWFASRITARRSQDEIDCLRRAPRLRVRYTKGGVVAAGGVAIPWLRPGPARTTRALVAAVPLPKAPTPQRASPRGRLSTLRERLTLRTVVILERGGRQD